MFNGNKINLDVYRQDFAKSEAGKEQMKKILEVENQTEVIFQEWVNTHIFKIPKIEAPNLKPQMANLEGQISDLNAKLDSVLDGLKQKQGGPNE